MTATESTLLQPSRTSAPPTHPTAPVLAASTLPSTRRRILTISTIAFTLLFAVWVMFGILAIPIQAELGLSDLQLSWISAVAILSGSLCRLAFGLLADYFGGRKVMVLLLLVSALPTFLVAFAHSYGTLLLCAFFIGITGNGFSVGISWNSAWYPRHTQGYALGVFGAGNVGASVTKLIGPAIIAAVPAAGFSILGLHLPGGWRLIPITYALLLLIMAGITFFTTPLARLHPRPGPPPA